MLIFWQLFFEQLFLADAEAENFFIPQKTVIISAAIAKPCAAFIKRNPGYKGKINFAAPWLRLRFRLHYAEISLYQIGKRVYAHSLHNSAAQSSRHKKNFFILQSLFGDKMS